MGKAQTPGARGTLTLYRFTREGQPVPVQPDFDNLKQVWATISPTGVESAAYAATFSAKLPQCPDYTAGGWEVSPAASLPTLNAQAVSSGMASGVPSGSITVSGITNPSAAPTNGTGPGESGVNSTGTPSSTSTAGAQSGAQESAMIGGNYGLLGVLAAALVLGASFVFMI
jgi:1,3-beta-glucanosyltransferase GAS1